jgi:peptidyl-prolyl cis-trans isomerase SurA
MKKLLTAFCLTAAFSAPAQTLFTYGKDAVAVPDFVQAFQKNNQGPATEKALKEYLDLYISSRLKIKEARAMGYDTLPQLIADGANLRQQILPAYLNDRESMEKLVKEAFNRSQKDLQVAHIFIAASAGADAKKDAVLQALAKRDFATVAKEFSDDPSAKSNSGNLGWITAFSLPYELETLAYSTSVGKISAPYRSKAGYHILKTGGERKAMGQIKAAQLLLAVPPTSSEADKTKLKKTADSLYARLQAGDDFGKLAAAFSNDVVSAASAGQMTEFGVGEYDPLFETAVINLPKDGAISRPFLTTHGYHIVKRIKVLPVAAKLDEETKEALRKRIEQSDRAGLVKAALAQKVLKNTGYQRLPFSDAELQAYTDSVLSFQVPKISVSLTAATPLLKMGKEAITVAQWTEFAQGARLKRDGTGAKPHAQLWDEFVEATALNYYQDHLEDFNEDFRRQITEFAEGNLFFEIMQRQVWTPAQTDSAALAAYFQQHKSNYNWKESADAVLFYASEEAAAKAFHTALRQKPSEWRTVLLNFSEQITADSNRFEVTQLPVESKQRLAPGAVIGPVVNKADNTVLLAYVLKLHPQPEPRSFAEAKGLVINDYQAQLEKEWLQQLKKKYPVTVNEKEWSSMVKQLVKK